MPVRLDHTAIAARDKWESARFFADVFGLAEPKAAGPFVGVRLSDGADLDFADSGGEVTGQHYAFLVDDETFDRVLERIVATGTPYWADPRASRPGEINTNHGGRGVYFTDPSGHHLEALTRRYDGTDLG